MSSEPIERHEAVVIGAGPAGLAAAAMLGREGVETLVLERESIGASWRKFYERLHLHTIRWLSGLPGLPIDRREGRWVSREGVVTYLERYARYHRLNVRETTEVRKLNRYDGEWVIETTRGRIAARFVVVATGFNRDPYLPDWRGRNGFTGDLVHSLHYRNATPYRGKDALVVGTGNSGAEIAVDLVEGGARDVMISVRTPPNILRRDVAGFPSQLTGILARRLPLTVADRISLAMQRLTVGDLSPYGLPPPRVGAVTRVNQDSVPILDVGLIDLVKKRRVEVVPAVEAFEGPEVVLAGGRRIRPHAVIAATGFRHGLEPLVGRFGLIGPAGRPVVHGAKTHPNAPDLYFIGFTNPISGNLREVGIDAKRIAKAVSRARKTERETSKAAVTP
ncbi:MAG TPA: NAD(P)/FAD-dependent oxidoreductase [Actinomycetota bacterium]|nr:NAD(P)/FAD-dependent oxidoreductase [Actinomycetota bacterium]